MCTRHDFGQELGAVYASLELLEGRSMPKAARDFYSMRKENSRTSTTGTVRLDPLKLSKMSTLQFLTSCSGTGARVPAFQRKGERSLSAVFRARAGSA